MFLDPKFMYSAIICFIALLNYCYCYIFSNFCFQRMGNEGIHIRKYWVFVWELPKHWTDISNCRSISYTKYWQRSFGSFLWFVWRCKSCWDCHTFIIYLVRIHVVPFFSRHESMVYIQYTYWSFCVVVGYTRYSNCKLSRGWKAFRSQCILADANQRCLFHESYGYVNIYSDQFSAIKWYIVCW